MHDERIRLLLVDDHTLFRQTLRIFLHENSTCKVIGEAENGVQAVEQAKSLEPDVILMDLHMPEMDGVSATRILHQRMPSIPIIILTTAVDSDILQLALQMGATGYILKSSSIESLVEAIQAATKGNTPFTPETTQILIDAYLAQEQTGPFSSLTEREYEVMCLLTHGYNNAKIANELTITESTVKFHVSNLLTKMRMNSRTEIVSYAASRRWHLA